jgi:anti-sigma-K factor RskA
LETAETRSPTPPAPGSKVDPLLPLPGSVLGAATIVAAQGALAAIGVFIALLAPHATRIRYLGHGIGAWRFPAACMLSAFAVVALVAAVGLVDRRGWARPVAFAVEASVICGYLLTFVFDPFRALLGMTVAIGVLALVLGPGADAAFAPVETD